MADILDSVWTYVIKMRGKCAANTDIDDLKTSVKMAQGKIDKVLQGGKLLQSDSRIFEKLTKANENLGKVGNALDKMSEVCIDIDTVNKIHKAVLTLDEMQYINDDPDKAAAAFGQLFAGIGLLCRHVPALKEWGQFFSNAGDLFVNVHRGQKMSTEMSQHLEQSRQIEY